MTRSKALFFHLPFSLNRRLTAYFRITDLSHRCKNSHLKLHQHSFLFLLPCLCHVPVSLQPDAPEAHLT